MKARDAILGRIRVALREMAPIPPAGARGEVFPPLSPDELLPRFEREFAALKGSFHCVASLEEARARLAELAATRGWGRLAFSPDDGVASLAANLPGARVLELGEGGAWLDAFDAGVTGCDALVARTGSIALTAQSGFGRALSVLPPAHVVVARRAQLVAEIADALSRLASRYGRSWPSMLSFITGPSRTADIEKILVLGAHGPRELHLLFVNA